MYQIPHSKANETLKTTHVEDFEDVAIPDNLYGVRKPFVAMGKMIANTHDTRQRSQPCIPLKTTSMSQAHYLASGQVYTSLSRVFR